MPPPESIFTLADNPHLLTIQPDLSTTTTTCQGSLCPRQDGTSPKFQLANGHLLSPLSGGRHTLHHSSPTSEAEDFVSRLSTQNYFRSLPRGTSNMTYGTFNFLGGRLMIPNTGGKDPRVPRGALRGKISFCVPPRGGQDNSDVCPVLLSLTPSAEPGQQGKGIGFWRESSHGWQWGQHRGQSVSLLLPNGTGLLSIHLCGQPACVCQTLLGPEPRGRTGASPKELAN